jgi:hypothetical protein
MIKVYLIIDESGAKGYSNNKEKIECEFGVMAGYLIKENAIQEVKSLSKKCFCYEDKSEKLHITDLSKDEQSINRNKLYSLCINNNLSWIYNAIYVNGFYSANENLSKKLLHEELFKGIFIKAVAQVYDVYKDKEIHIEVITDTIDETTRKKFNQSLNDFISIITKKDIIKLTKKSNRETKKSELFKFVTKTELDDNIATLNSLTYNVSCENNSLTFIADILSNTVNYYLKEKVNIVKDIKLNSYDAINQHPLSHLVYGCFINDINLFDVMFRRDYNKNIVGETKCKEN